LDSAAGRWRCNHCNPLWQPRFPPNPKSSSLEGISGPPLLHRRRSRVVKDLGRDFDSRGMQTCRGSNPPPMPLWQMPSASISTETGLVFEGEKRHATPCMSSLQLDLSSPAFWRGVGMKHFHLANPLRKRFESASKALRIDSFTSCLNHIRVHAGGRSCHGLLLVHELAISTFHCRHASKLVLFCQLLSRGSKRWLLGLTR